MSTASRWCILLLAAMAVVWGWSAFDYLSDDAYIAFRYVRNLVDGHGLVYNRGPFRPVEGYSSFAWVVLLAGLWSAFGIGPEAGSPWLSLGCSLASLYVILRLVRAVGIRDHGWPLLLVFGLIVSNRTWLAWTSSGLETPLWTLVVLVWLLAGLERRPSVLVVLGALMPLVRPDGLLWAAVSPAIALWIGPVHRAAWAVYLLPLMHGGWRLSMYGEWLPNTYYAKVNRPWPLMGGVQLATFVYEYMWAPALGLTLWGAVRHRVRPVNIVLVGVLVAATCAHLRWGGDHFAYRLFAHWVPLFAIGGVWACTRWHWRALPTGLLLGGAWVGLLLPWAHWATHDTIHWMPQPIEVDRSLKPVFPSVMGGWVGLWERSRTKLQYHLISTPHHQLRRFIEVQRWWYRDLPELPQDDLHVLHIGNPGWPGWALPDVAVIDSLGLTDHPTAHAPLPPLDKKRKIAHERRATRAYVDCFRPDVALVYDEEANPQVQVIYTPRDAPLTADEVRACEARWWDGVERH